MKEQGNEEAIVNGVGVFIIFCIAAWGFMGGNGTVAIILLIVTAIGWGTVGNIFVATYRAAKGVKQTFVPDTGKRVQKGNMPTGEAPTERVKSNTLDTGAATIQPPLVTEAPALSKANKSWFTGVVENAVHVLVIGETGSGKSVAAKAILTARAKRGEDIIILDPHARPSTWNGLDAVGKGRDYPAIESMIGTLQAELDRRYREYALDDNYNPKRLNIFVDEVPSIVTYCESWQEFFTVLSCEARKVNMSLICLSQSRLVEMLGIKGRSDVRENFTELLLGDKAIRVVKDLAGSKYPAVLDMGGKVQPVDTSSLVALGTTELDAGVLWVPPVSLASQKPAQRVTEDARGITTSPLTDEEKNYINDLVADEESRREIAKRVYKKRGGLNMAYSGDGPLSVLIKKYLDDSP